MRMYKRRRLYLYIKDCIFVLYLLLNMKGIFFFFLVLGMALSAKVSENCLWGRTSAAICCKSIPNSEPTHLANPTDCTSYYVCRNNKPISLPCAPGQVWDVKQQKCVDSSDPTKCPQKTE